MYCSKCGCQIPDNSQFCSKCGSPQMQIEQKQLTPSNAEKELDREAIKIYLSNVLALEYAIDILNRKWSSVNQEIVDFERNNYYEVISITEKEKLGLYYDGKKYYMHFNVTEYNKTYIGLYWSQFCKISWQAIDENWEYINRTANWPSTFKSGGSVLIDIFVGSIVDAIQRKSKKTRFLEAYASFKARAPGRYADNLKKIQPKKDERSSIQEEARNARQLLQEAYSINIIPEQFRNIYAVWFIHNYISTSNETLTSALLHCDMDSIKHKLDTIISQNQEIIMNQAIISAQNRQILEQNQHSLKHLAAIETNTEMAAQYAQIAANNAEACAWIGAASFLR